MTVLHDSSTQDVMSCPTCKARQEWSDECRRCKCDLSMLHQVWMSGRQLRQRCLCALRNDQLPAARAFAERYASLLPSDDAFRLLAVCHLLASDWPAALAASRRA
jgi:hypothetical protein